MFAVREISLSDLTQQFRDSSLRRNHFDKQTSFPLQVALLHIDSECSANKKNPRRSGEGSFLKRLCGLAALQSLDELWQHLVHVSNNSQVCNTKDWCFLVLVDGDDVL